jgi:hypothetical protein
MLPKTASLLGIGARGRGRLRTAAAVVSLVLLVAACAGPAGSPGTGGSVGTATAGGVGTIGPGASTPPGPGPSPGSQVTILPVQKLAVLKAVGGHLDYCDPDVYPIARGEPIDAARERLPAIKKDTEAYRAILAAEDLQDGQQFTDQQILAISDDYKQIQVIMLSGSGDYTFSVLVVAAGEQYGNQKVGGTVSADGRVTIDSRDPGEPINCPICLAHGVFIATPRGPVPVQDLRVGMPVWTTDVRGRRIAGVVLATGSMQAPRGHEVVRLALADGRVVSVSPGHPALDGRPVGSLAPGDPYDGSRVVSAARVAYAGFTYDLLPSGPTGTYFADGILLGSTLVPSR